MAPVGAQSPGSVGALNTEAAADPGAVGVVERDELGGDEPRGFVDLLGGGGRVLVDEQPPQLLQAVEASRPLGSEDAVALERLQVAAGLQLVAAGADLGKLESEGGSSAM